MKNTLGLLDSNTTEEKYYVENNEIVVRYISGRCERFPYSKELEETIISHMIDSAIRRNNMYDDSLDSKTFLCVGSASLLATIVRLVMMLRESGEYETIITVQFIIAIIAFAIFKEKRANEREIKKYKIYLDNREEIEKYTKVILTDFRGRKYPEVGYVQLNINTIDDFTLEEVEVIIENLELCKVSAEIYKRFRQLIPESPKTKFKEQEAHEGSQEWQYQLKRGN